MLRKLFKAIRKEKFDFINNNPEIAINTNNLFRANILSIIDKYVVVGNNYCIASYFTINDEIDSLNMCIFFKKYFADKGIYISICLPKMTTDQRWLRFYEYDENKLITGKFNIKEPDTNICKETVPNLILTPLLCFDKFKNRIGYGKGCYDNTFLKLNTDKIKYISIGIAYDEQLFEGTLPIDEYDQKLDYVVTPDKIYQ